MTMGPTGPEPERIPWDIDVLSGEELRAAYVDLARFVAWLRECDIDVPTCWYVHGWVVRRLAVLRHWRQLLLTGGGPPKGPNEWWTALFNLQRDWGDLRGHHGAHPPRERPWEDPVATPSLENAIAAAVRTAGGPS